MFRDDLSERDEYADLQCHLTMVLLTISSAVHMSKCNGALCKSSQEHRHPQHDIFNPIETECNDVRGRDSNSDELEQFYGAPQSLKVSQRCRNDEESEE